METHVKVLGVLHIILGALGIFCALILMIILGGAATAVVAEGDPDAALAIPILGIVGAGTAAFLVLASVPGIAAGWGLIKFRPWGRILALVLSILALVLFPFGTLVGIYGLWVLLNKDAERLFVPTQA
jgi:hypothetical protein